MHIGDVINTEKQDIKLAVSEFNKLKCKKDKNI